MAFGVWGQRWVESQLSLQNLDPSLLMWDMRRNLNPDAAAADQRSMIQFLYPELPPAQAATGGWWSSPTPSVDLCSVDPGFDVDLYVSADLRTMTAIWMGLDSVRAPAATADDTDGNRQLASSMQTWLGLSPFASERSSATLAERSST